ncbi:MAG TPA: SPOR domain-containing protein, partial [Pseudomonadales bacterium]|nr:SPOR domain-containing protein [Pseudomonadales bacterium]
KVRNYIDRELGCKDCYYYETRRDGKPWFTVVKGVYADRAAAVAARDKLPAKVRAQQPWPRSVRDIQKELRQQR